MKLLKWTAAEMICSRAVTINRVEHQPPWTLFTPLYWQLSQLINPSKCKVEWTEWKKQQAAKKEEKMKNKTSFTTIGRTPTVRHDCDQSGTADDAVPIFAQLPQIQWRHPQSLWKNTHTHTRKRDGKWATSLHLTIMPIGTNKMKWGNGGGN